MQLFVVNWMTSAVLNLFFSDREKIIKAGKTIVWCHNGESAVATCYIPKYNLSSF